MKIEILKGSVMVITPETEEDMLLAAAWLLSNYGASIKLMDEKKLIIVDVSDELGMGAPIDIETTRALH